jgi:hypothetical protein
LTQLATSYPLYMIYTVTIAHTTGLHSYLLYHNGNLNSVLTKVRREQIWDSEWSECVLQYSDNGLETVKKWNIKYPKSSGVIKLDVS